MTKKVSLTPQQIIEPYLGKFKMFFSWKDYANKFSWKIKPGNGNHKIRLEVRLIGTIGAPSEHDRVQLRIKIGGYMGKKTVIYDTYLTNPDGPKILAKRINHLVKAVGIRIDDN